MLQTLSCAEWAELDAYIASALASFEVPGAAVALIQNGEVDYVGTYGVRGVEDAIAVDEDTRFMIGSITKSMTTTLAATLVHDGQLGWDDAVVDHLPSFALSDPNWTPLVRMRDAFGHTSGVPRDDLPLFFRFSTPLELTETVAHIPALAPPGERYEYQNQVFAAGGFAAVAAAGVELRDDALARGLSRLMRRRVFEPLGMRRTTLSFDAATADENHAAPHALDARGAAVASLPIGFERFATPVAPAGAVWSTIGDMARYFAMHLRDGESVDGDQLFPEAELAETHAPHVALGGGANYALGWITADSSFGPTLGHDGGTAGFTARVYGLSDPDFGIVILTNSSAGGAFLEAVTRYTSELARGLPHAGDADLLAPLAEAKALYAEVLAALAPVSALTVEGVLGRYEQELTVGLEGDDLIITTVYGPLPFRTLPGSDGLFLGVGNVLFALAAQFTTDAAGQVTLALGPLDSDENGLFIRPTISAARLDNDRKTAPLAARAFDARVPLDSLAASLRAASWGLR